MVLHIINALFPATTSALPISNMIIEEFLIYQIKIGESSESLCYWKYGLHWPCPQSCSICNFPKIEIMGFDAGFFGHSLTGADFTPEQGVSVQFFGDVRDIEPAMLTGVDAVVHLAGVSNDPIGVEFEDVTED